MNKMKALQIVDKEKIEIVILPIPEPGPGQVLVKVSAVTTCPQWDLHIYYGKPMFTHQSAVPFPYPPGQPGHEMTGTVAKLGEGCTRFETGQRVSAWKDPGHLHQGCYAEYVLMDEKYLLAVPENLHFTQVASLELAMCVGASIMKLKPAVGIAGKTCAVNGLGPAGLIALQMLLAEGASRVVGIDPNPERRELARQLGADRAFAPGAKEVVPRGEVGAFDVAVDCVGYAEAVRYIMDHTTEAVALFAVQREDYIFHHKSLTVIGYPGHHREAAEYALGMIIDNKLNLAPLASVQLPLEEYAQAVELLRDQKAVKVCFVPGME
ncbi:MAG: tdh 3 [Paenibacillus sp.]|nr:tdh 3 [Paenibacillus sp.]